MSKRNLIELLKIFKEEVVYVTLLGDNIVSLLVHPVLYAATSNMARFKCGHDLLSHSCTQNHEIYFVAAQVTQKSEHNLIDLTIQLN